MFKTSFISLLIAASPATFATTIQSSICEPVNVPVFTTQDSTTTATTEIISGTTSSNIAVSVQRNTQHIATLTSDSSGTFSLQVSLAPGSNSFTATSTNNCGSASSQDPVTITRTLQQNQESPMTPIIASPSNEEPAEQEVTPTTQETTTKPDVITLRITAPSGEIGTAANTLTTSDESVFLKGMSHPSAHIEISNNDIKVADLIAANDGSFGVLIPLSKGTNILTIQASFAGVSTTQILTYIRNEKDTPQFTALTISGAVVIGAAIVGLILHNKLQLKHKSKRRR